jgi:hypothetical protein|tara:strand:+ start:239 stop:391 length:153 start_codon:yes stop_codon:yes gene_type:complete
MTEKLNDYLAADKANRTASTVISIASGHHRLKTLQVTISGYLYYLTDMSV